MLRKSLLIHNWKVTGLFVTFLLALSSPAIAQVTLVQKLQQDRSNPNIDRFPLPAPTPQPLPRDEEPKNQKQMLVSL